MASPVDTEKIKRWRLILGQHAQEALARMGGAGGCQLGPEQAAMDEALAAIYDESGAEGQRSQRSAGLGPSAPNLAKWLGDILNREGKKLGTRVEINEDNNLVLRWQ